MILLDASILVEYLRTKDQALEKALSELELGVCGVTRAELLHGARDASDEQKLRILLDQFDAIHTPEEIWDKVGQRLCELRRAGITVPFTDGVLATIAVERDVEVWSLDRHFRLMVSVFPLKLYHA